MLLKPRSKGVNYAVGKGQNKHIIVWEWQLDEMRGNNLANRVGVDQSGEEDERDKMLVQNDGLQVEVCWNQRPGYEERDEAEQGNSRLLTALVADFDYVLCTGKS